MSYNPNNPNGQATMENSQSVVVASDQSPIHVIVDSSTTEKDIAFNLEISDGDFAILDVENISSVAFILTDDCDVLGSVDGITYTLIPILKYFRDYSNGIGINYTNSSVDTSSIKYLRFNNTIALTDITVNGFKSRLLVNPNGAPTSFLQEAGNITLSTMSSNVSTINTRDSDIDYAGNITPSTPFVIDVEEKGTLSFTTSGTWTGTIIVEASLDGIDWRPTTYVALSSGNSSFNFSANTSGQINCVGLDFIRFRSNTISSGSATIVAMSSRLVSNVMLDNPLPTGPNTIGAVNINGGNSIAVKTDSSATTQPISAIELPLATGASTSANQTNGTQKTKITDGTLNASLLEGGASYVGLVTSVGPALFLSSTANSSTAQLAANATFIGTIETVFSQPAIQVNMVSDQPMIITINQYIDAAGLKRSGAYGYSIPAGAGFDMCLPMAGNYFNVTAQNIGAATTTTFTLDVTYGTMQAVDTYGAQTISVTQLAYGTANAVYVGGTSQIQVTPTVTSASAYASGNVVGGLLTFPNIVNSTVKSGVLESITIAIKSLQTASFKLYIFRGLPSTTFNNKTAPAIVVGDADKLLDVYSFTTPDNGLGNNVTLYYSDAINRSLVLDGSSMYGVLVTLGTPTFTTTTDVIVTASILRD